MEVTEIKKTSPLDSIVPSIKTEITENHGTCMFVFAEPGKWDANKALYKLGAGWDGTGWLVPIHHKKEVEALCQQANMVAGEIQLPEDFESFKNNAQLGLLQSQMEITEREIRALTHKENIVHNDIDSLYDKDLFPGLSSTINGRRIEALLYKRLATQNKITLISNQQVISQIPIQSGNTSSNDKKSICATIGDVIKKRDVLNKIIEKTREYQRTGQVTLSGISTGFNRLDTVIGGDSKRTSYYSCGQDRYG